MDHVINSLEPFYNVNLKIVVNEYETGNYETFCDCPGFGELEAITNAMNIMCEYVGMEELDINDELEFELEMGSMLCE